MVGLLQQSHTKPSQTFEYVLTCCVSVLLIVAVVSLGLMILLLAAVCVSLTCMKCRRKKNYSAGGWSQRNAGGGGRKEQRVKIFTCSVCSAAASKKHEDAELQPWRTSDRQTGNTVRSLYCSQVSFHL